MPFLSLDHSDIPSSPLSHSISLFLLLLSAKSPYFHVDIEDDILIYNVCSHRYHPLKQKTTDRNRSQRKRIKTDNSLSFSKDLGSSHL